MMVINHKRKVETFNIDDMKITVEAYQKTSMGNPAGFSVCIKGTGHKYHVNVLEINDAISRGLHKFLQRELGLDDMVTYMNVNPDNETSIKPVTLCIKARDGKFQISNVDGEFSVKESTDLTTKECGMRTWKITHPDFAENICTVCRCKGDELYLAIGTDMTRTGHDLYEAVARLVCNII